jgi:hypothetical protein
MRHSPNREPMVTGFLKAKELCFQALLRRGTLVVEPICQNTHQASQDKPST